MRRRILVVAPDASVRAGLARLLKGAGYNVELAEDAAHARRIGLQGFALSVIGPDGLGPDSTNLIAELDSEGAKSLLIADLSDEAGLLARISDALRPAPETNEPARVLRFAEYALDLAGRSLTTAVGKDVPLTRGEFNLLREFVQRPGRVLSRDQLLTALSGRDAEAYDRSIDMLVARLRRKIEADPQRPSLILTVLGSGYKFAAKVTAETAAEPAAPKAEPPPETPPEPKPALALPDRPSIAVLPFENMSGDPEQEYFADGMVEEITTALSRVRWLFIIARNSSFTYKGRAVDVKQVGRELGVHYVLEGSVRKSGGNVRITAQLIDAAMGAHLWADRFDGNLQDVFALQDEVAGSVVAIVEPTLRKAEVERSRLKPTDSLDAYDFFLRALASESRMSSEGDREALDFLHRAIGLDPQYGAAYGLASWCHTNRLIQGWFTNVHSERTEGVRLALLAAEHGKEDATALYMAGLALAHIGQESATGMALIDRALLLNPNLAPAWMASGFVLGFHLGEHETALEHLLRAARLSPLDPMFHMTATFIGANNFFLSRYGEASVWLQRALIHQPNFGTALRMSAANYALAGNLVEAAKLVERICKLFANQRLSDVKGILQFWRPEMAEKYFGALRKAGMPE